MIAAIRNPNTSPNSSPVVIGLSDGANVPPAATITTVVYVVSAVCPAGNSVVISYTEHPPLFSQERDTVHHGRTAANRTETQENDCSEANACCGFCRIASDYFFPSHYSIIPPP